MKVYLPFKFDYDLKQKVVRDLRIVTLHLPLRVEGMGCMESESPVTEPDARWTADIEAIYYDGKEVRELLDFTGTLEEIEEAAAHHVAELFQGIKEVA